MARKRKHGISVDCLEFLPDGTARLKSGATDKRPSTWIAVPTEVEGIKFASKSEARAYQYLKRVLPEGHILFCQVRLPLMSLAHAKNRRPMYITVDFMICRHTGTKYEWLRAIDSKPPTKVSRDWKRGKAAFESCYGLKLEHIYIPNDKELQRLIYAQK
jgi:hypothetical protein